MQSMQDYIRIYDHALEPAFCEQMIAGFEQQTSLQNINGRGIRDGLEQSAWTEIDIGRLADQAFIGFFLAQVDTFLARYNQDIRLTIPVPLRPRTDKLTLKRYRTGGNESFQPHFDAVDVVSSRYLVFLWYLNDVTEGGETEFCDMDLKISPRAGRLLMFPPYWMFQHAGRPPVSNDKYILSTYLMF